MTERRRVLLASAVIMLCPLVVAAPQAARPIPEHECTVTADDFAYSPARIEVRQNEIVRIAFDAVDIPHTFTIDEYRIAKRAATGQTVVFEFRADRVGTFPIYCTQTADDRCKRMKGSLVVTP